jgi:hypothetical protein
MLLGISASFPLIITREQKGFYLVTSFPYYAIAFAISVAPHLSHWIEKIPVQHISFRIFRMISILLFVVVLTFSFLQIGKAGRDATMIHDVHLIGRIIPKGTVLGSTKELWQEWSLQEYLVRHYYICMASEILPECEYIIIDSAEKISQKVKLEKVNIPTIKYHLYKKISRC